MSPIQRAAIAWNILPTAGIPGIRDVEARVRERWDEYGLGDL